MGENEYKEDRSLFDLCGGFNTPTLASGVSIDFIITAMIMNIPFRILVMYPTIIEGKHWKKGAKIKNH